MPDFGSILMALPLIAGAILPPKPGATVRAWLDRKKTPKNLMQISDLAWNDKLSAGSAFSAVESILDHLGRLVPILTPLEPSMVACDYKSSPDCNTRDCTRCKRSLSSVFMISKRCNSHVTELEKQYISVQKLSPALEQQIWNNVHSYYRYLNHAYQTCIDAYLADPAGSGLQPKHLTVLLGHCMENLCNLTLWYYLRYQQPPDGHWLRIHRTYQLAETHNCSTSEIKLHSGLQSSISARYTRALMLDTLNFSEMHKTEIALVDEWLRSWMRDIVITDRYDEAIHLFHVNLEQDHGARRIRLFTPTPACRYWETDRISEGIPNFRKLLDRGDKNLAFEILRTREIERWLVLLDHIYAEWSRSAYRRQRRRENRNETMKAAHVAHGIQGCYLMIKDQVSAQRNRRGFVFGSGQSLDEKLMRHSVLHPAANTMMPWLAAEKWTLRDQSERGLGATVNAEIAARLKIGRLVSLVLDDRRNAVTLGVIRNIKSLANGDRNIGIEILSPAAIPVQLSDFSQKSAKPAGAGFAAEDELTAVMENNYGGLLIPENPAQGVTRASVILPASTYQQAANLKMKEPDSADQRITLSDLIEQKDDWVWVGLIRQPG